MVQARVGNRREQALAICHQPAGGMDCKGVAELSTSVHMVKHSYCFPQAVVHNRHHLPHPATHLTHACSTADMMRGPPLAPMASTRLPLRSAISGLMLLNGFFRGLGREGQGASADASRCWDGCLIKLGSECLLTQHVHSCDGTDQCFNLHPGPSRT